MKLTKTLRFPCLAVSAITASTISLLENDLVSLVISMFEAIHANDATAISRTCIALRNYINTCLLV